MKITISPQLAEHVREELRREGRPRRVSQIAKALGKSVTTIRTVLDAGVPDVLRVIDSYPAEWTYAGVDEKPEPVAEVTAITAQVPRVGESRGQDFIVSAPDLEPAEIVEVWNSSHKRFAKAIEQMQIEATTKPKIVGEQLANFAGSVAALADLLLKHSGKPDWLDEIS